MSILHATVLIHYTTRQRRRAQAHAAERRHRALYRYYKYTLRLYFMSILHCYYTSSTILDNGAGPKHTLPTGGTAHSTGTTTILYDYAVCLYYTATICLLYYFYTTKLQCHCRSSNPTLHSHPRRFLRFHLPAHCTWKLLQYYYLRQ